MVYELVQSKRLFCVTKTNKQVFGFHNIIFLLIDLKERVLYCMSQSNIYMKKKLVLWCKQNKNIKQIIHSMARAYFNLDQFPLYLSPLFSTGPLRKSVLIVGELPC